MSQSKGFWPQGGSASIHAVKHKPAVTMRRLLPLFVASVALASGVTGCGGGSNSAAPASTPTPAPGPAPAPAPGPAPAPAPVPAVTSVTPERFVPPARINVAGTDLDRVTQARLNSTVLSIASQSPTALALDVPVNASSGFLTLVADGTTRQTAFQVIVDGPIGIASVSPTTVVRGNSLTINGTNLDRAATVEFTGGATAPVASRTGSIRITVTVPDAAQSGSLTVIGNAGDRVVAATSVTVVPRIVVDANATYSAPATGATVTISGSGLSQVSGVSIGSIAATIGARTETQLSFVVPNGISCGPITLESQSQPDVSAGGLVVGGGCALRAAGIEFAQVLSQTAGSTYQRIVPRKETLVRVYVVSATANSAAPTVRLTAFNGATQLGTLPMTGPATLPQVAVSGSLPDSLRYDETLTFNATLPADWVRAGLAIRVEVDPEQLFGSGIVNDATPAVGGTTGVDLVLVPLVSGSNVPTMPALADIVDELVRRFPLAREEITVSIRAPFTLASPTDGVDTSSEWSSVLQQLEQLRRTEAPNRHYYGMVRPMVSAGTAGIGYVNRVGSSSPNLSSLGWDATRNWRRTMSHELGHNFSRSHAPCGGVANPDTSYPYEDGVLGTAPLFESLLDNIQSPAGLTDIMGYCSGSWFSDYNYREVQRFMEAQPQTLVSAQGNTEAPVPLLTVSGVIKPQGVQLAPVQQRRGRAVVSVAGEYVLRLRTSAGPVIDVPFDATEVDHADESERHFFVQVPNPGDLARVSVLRAGFELMQLAGSAPGTATAQGRSQSATPVAAPEVQWRETGGQMDFAWDATSWPWVTVTHVAGDTRTVLAIDRTGGSARVATTALPAGGVLEFSLSDGLRSRLVESAR